VRVFNDRGSTLLPVKVTPRIAQGVISIKEGAWFTPDADGTDTKGYANVLAEDRSAPCGATTYNTNLVEACPAADSLLGARWPHGEAKLGHRPQTVQHADQW
jgi:anaerobic dimethyl sulfoxide reductase subunit A